MGRRLQDSCWRGVCNRLEPRFLGEVREGLADLMARHLPNLDGLRTVAAFLVFLQHCNHFPIYSGAPFFITGLMQRVFFNQAHLGVQFFFVLSGFLITRIVLEQMDSQRFRLGEFWKRRILRIWPVYFLVCLLGLALSFTGWPNFAMAHNRWPMLLAFLENYDLRSVLAAGLQQGYIVSVLWSVSIEEQFYLVYPLLLLLVPRRFYGPFLMAVLVLAGAYKVSVGPDSLDGQFQTFSSCYELGWGCLLAVWVGSRGRHLGKLFPLAYLALALTLFAPKQAILTSLIALLRPLLFCAILVDQAYCPHSALQTRKVPGLNWLGKFTYGFYCYHVVFVILAHGLLLQNGLEPRSLGSYLLYVLTAGLLAVMASFLSYFLMERPLLRLGTGRGHDLAVAESNDRSIREKVG